jgi:hypothetical protein
MVQETIQIIAGVLMPTTENGCRPAKQKKYMEEVHVTMPPANKRNGRATGIGMSMNMSMANTARVIKTKQTNVILKAAQLSSFFLLII